MKRANTSSAEKVVSKKARVVEKSMKTKILETGNNIDDLWALISADLQDGFQSVVSKMNASAKKRLASDIASYKVGDVFVEFLSSDFETLFWKIEDKYELPLGHFEKFYDELVDPVNFLASKEISLSAEKEEEEEEEAIESGSSSSEEEEKNCIEEIEDVDDSSNDYTDDDYDPNDEDNYSDDSENDSILSD